MPTASPGSKSGLFCQTFSGHMWQFLCTWVWLRACEAVYARERVCVYVCMCVSAYNSSKNWYKKCIISISNLNCCFFTKCKIIYNLYTILYFVKILSGLYSNCIQFVYDHFCIQIVYSDCIQSVYNPENFSTWVYSSKHNTQDLVLRIYRYTNQC